MRSPKIYIKKSKDILSHLKIARKRITAILAILMLLMQYIVMPTYATATDGYFTADECPYDIEFVKIEVGYHSLAIDSEGNLWTWGKDQYGQLGTDKVHNNSFDGLCTRTPEKIMEGTKFSEISMGEEYSMAIDTEGNLWAWGLNDYGQLGDGTTNNSTTPIKIKSGTKFSKVSASINSTVALDVSGNIWAWGSNSDGWLGYHGLDSSTPVQVQSGTKFIEIAVNHKQCLAIDENYNLWGWGDKNLNDSQDGTTDSSYFTPVQIKNGTMFKEISSSGNLVALDNSGNIWIWGNETEAYDMTEPQMKDTGKTFSHIGGNIAIDIDQNLWAWGDNYFGQLGNGTTTSTEELIQVKSGTKFKYVSSTSSASSRAVVDTEGNTWTWGYNKYGGLGTGKVNTNRCNNSSANNISN